MRSQICLSDKCERVDTISGLPWEDDNSFLKWPADSIS